MADKVNPEAKAIGHAVRAALAVAGLSLSQASAGTGINLTTLSRRVNGTLPFTFPELVRIADLCGVKVSDLASAAEEIAARGAASGPPQAAAEMASEAGKAPPTLV